MGTKADRLNLENKIARLERALREMKQLVRRNWGVVAANEWADLKTMCEMVARGERKPEHLQEMVDRMDDAINEILEDLFNKEDA